MRRGNGLVLAAVLIASAAAGAVAIRVGLHDAVGRSHLRAAERRLGLEAGAEPQTRPDTSAPDSANGAASFRSAIDRLRVPPELEIASYLRRLRGGEPIEDPEAIERLLESNRETLASLHAAAAASRLDFDWHLTPDEAYPLQKLALDAARLLEVSGWWALRAGDRDATVRAARTLGRLSRGWFDEDSWITADGFERSGLNLLHELVAEPGLSPALAAAARRSVLPRPRGDRELLRADAAEFLRRIESVERWGGRQRPTGRLTLWTVQVKTRHWAAETLHTHADLIELADRPYPEWRTELERRSEERAARGLRQLERSTFIGFLLRVAESNREIARLALDLRLQAAETGRYPAELPATAPAADPLGGRPWRYERREDGGAELSAPGAIAAIEDFRVNPEGWRRLSTWRLGAPQTRTGADR